jgi:hypothetical protein
LRFPNVMLNHNLFCRARGELCVGIEFTAIILNYLRILIGNIEMIAII